jgi:hypothetical protein
MHKLLKNIFEFGGNMKKIFLLVGIVFILYCGSAVSSIDQWKTNDALTAQVYGGDNLTVYSDMTKYLSIDDSGVNKVYDAKLAATDVKTISMASSSFLILTDENGKQYTTGLEITNVLTLPNSSNVVMNHDGVIAINASDLGSPDVDWVTSLQFPEDLDLDDLSIGSFLEQMPDQDLEELVNYCDDLGIGYSAGCKMDFSESNDDLGVACRWGEEEKMVIGGGS